MRVVLISQSFDGELVTRTAKNMGSVPPADRARAALSAGLMGMKERIEEGHRRDLHRGWASRARLPDQDWPREARADDRLPGLLVLPAAGAEMGGEFVGSPDDSQAILTRGDELCARSGCRSGGDGPELEDRRLELQDALERRAAEAEAHLAKLQAGRKRS